MTKAAEAALAELRQMVLRMGSLAESILDKACRAVRERDADLGHGVKADDLEIDRIDVAIDDAILRVLALRAPVAEDLRQVIAIKAMAGDLERVGDLARNIAQSAVRLAGRAETRLPGRLAPLEREACRLLRLALDSFQQQDPATARAVIEGDDRADDLKDEIVRELIAEIERHPETASQAIDAIFIAESLERVADHGTNIAEDVILVAEARNVKHEAKLRS